MQFNSSKIILFTLLLLGCASVQNKYDIETLECSGKANTKKIIESWIPYFTAAHQEKKSKERWYIKDKKIYLRGPIVTGDFEYFKVLVKQFKSGIDAVNVVSGGGDTEAGSLIGKYIFDNNIPVEVQGPCLSSCANYLFGFSKYRKILPNGFVGFHGNHGALVKSNGGLKITIESLRKPITKFIKSKEGELTEKELSIKVSSRLKELEESYIGVMSREKSIYGQFGIRQSFFDNTQTVKKGYKGSSNKVDFSFLYPSQSGFEKLGFKIISGSPNNCFASHFYTRVNKKPTSVLIAK